MSASLKDRIALITGASRGIGQAVAKRFALEGAQVILVARDQKGLEETDDAIRKVGGSAILAPLDLTDFDKIDALAQATAQRFGKLDILVGNAGMLGEMTPLQDQSPEIWEKVMAVNVTANWRLIRAFDPLLKAAENPRAMFVTSGAAGRAYWGAYAVSKSALESMIQVYASENAKGSLRVNLIDPGAVRTRMRASAFPGEDPMTLPAPENVADLFVRLASPELKETGQVFHAR